MSVIIRLQNLPCSANAADIRQFFQGLSIPEDGVHIVGGEKRIAFISFCTDKDARQAMFSDGGFIKDVQIRLSLSSRNELQKVIETAKHQTIQTTQVYMHPMQQPQHQINIDNHQPPVRGPPANVGFNHFRIPPRPPIVPVLAANFYQQHPRYGGGGGGGGGRSSRFRWIQGGSGGRPPRFNPMLQQRGKDNGGGDGSDSKDPKRAAVLARFNDRYKFDVRYAQTPQVEGLCVELNNMPNYFSYGDVRKLFEGIHVDGSAIKIQKHRRGVAFVRFDNNHKKNLALRMNGNAYKGINLVVKHLDDEAYEQKDVDDRPYRTTVSATAGVVDLVDLMDNKEDNGGGQPPAKKRKNEEDSNNPVTCNKKPSATEGGGGGKGEGQQSSATLQPQQPHQPHQPLQQQQEAPTKYLKLKQLPITVTKEDVLNEIAGNNQVRRVTIYPDGEFMDAVLEFHSADGAEETLKRFDCVLLGCTPVPVLRCTYKEYVQVIRKSGGGMKRFSGESTSGGRHYKHQPHNPVTPQPSVQPNVTPTGSRSNCVHVLGLPTSVTYTDIAQFFADTSVLPDKIHIMLGKFGRPTGESYCEFSTVQQVHTALIKDKCYMGPNLVHVSPINRSDMVEAITKAMQQHDHRRDVSGDGPRQLNTISGPPKQQYQGPQYGGYTPCLCGSGPNSGPDGFEQSGCMVTLDNVPYGADVQEIVNFFSGFELNSRNVVRWFNDSGKPTGKVLVNLSNPQEAMRAVRILQNKFIFNRPVRLALL